MTMTTVMMTVVMMMVGMMMMNNGGGDDGDDCDDGDAAAADNANDNDGDDDDDNHSASDDVDSDDDDYGDDGDVRMRMMVMNYHVDTIISFLLSVPFLLWNVSASLHFLSFESFHHSVTVSGGVFQSSFVDVSPWLWPVAHARSSCKSGSPHHF